LHSRHTSEKEFLLLARGRKNYDLSGEHFTADTTPLKAWAGAKRFQRKDGKNAARGKRTQAARAQTRGRDFRMDENHRAIEETAASRRSAQGVVSSQA
jgi:hypothetical protein